MNEKSPRGEVNGKQYSFVASLFDSAKQQMYTKHAGSAACKWVKMWR